MRKFILVILLVILLCGCREKAASSQKVSLINTLAADDNWETYAGKDEENVFELSNIASSAILRVSTDEKGNFTKIEIERKGYLNAKIEGLVIVINQLVERTAELEKGAK